MLNMEAVKTHRIIKCWTAITVIILLTLSLFTPESARASSFVMVDLSKWNHPTKSVLRSNQIKLSKLMIVNNRYPVYFVKLPNPSGLQDQAKFESFLRQMAKANAYWSFELRDGTMNVKVTADPKKKAVKSISYIGLDVYFKKSAAIPVIRSQAGLHPVPVLSSFKHKVNDRLSELLAKPESYLDADWQDGIVRADHSGFIVSGRYAGTIVDTLVIGDPVAEVIRQLGQPSFRKQDEIFYRTDTFYFGIKGSDKVESAIFIPSPVQPKDKDILRKLIEALNLDPNLPFLTENSTFAKSIFNREGHIHGGGWFAAADFGIEIEQFDDNLITVYNNYEGNLYKSSTGSEYKVDYIDEDRVISEAHWSLEGNIGLDEQFLNKSLRSPTGKFTVIYEWNYSESHFFTVRYTDYSREDKIIGGAYGEYIWLSDDYLLATSAYFAELMVIPVTDEDAPVADIMSQIEGLKAKYDDSSDIHLQKMGTDSFTLEIDGTAYMIHYMIDEQGHIKMSYGKLK